MEPTPAAGPKPEDPEAEPEVAAEASSTTGVAAAGTVAAGGGGAVVDPSKPWVEERHRLVASSSRPNRRNPNSKGENKNEILGKGNLLKKYKKH